MKNVDRKIIVTLCASDGEEVDQYDAISDATANADHGDIIAVYELAKTGVVSIKTTKSVKYS